MTTDPSPEEKLLLVAEQLARKEHVAPTTVRELLAWFGAQRRGYQIIGRIRQALLAAKIRTEPDFEWVYIDWPISFSLIGDVAGQSTRIDSDDAKQVDKRGTNIDPIFRISFLAAANCPPISVTSNQTVTEAITIMLINDFSQLPIMTSERDVKGIVSWESIGKCLALGGSCVEVRDCAEDHFEVSADGSLFSALNSIIEHQYVLVRNKNKKISGIVTTSDLSIEFKQLSERFLLLSEIENQIRNILSRENFNGEALRSAKRKDDSDKEINDIYDLSFGHYVRIFQNEKHWSKIGLPVDRKIFSDRLDEIQVIRNDVMHFSPDPISPADIESLRKFSTFLQSLVISAARE